MEVAQVGIYHELTASAKQLSIRVNNVAGNCLIGFTHKENPNMIIRCITSLSFIVNCINLHLCAGHRHKQSYADRLINTHVLLTTRTCQVVLHVLS